MKKLCIFDMDGTVVNTINTIAYFANNALKRNGFDEIPTERYKVLVGNGADILVRRMLETVGGDERDFAAVSHEYNTKYDNDFMYLTEPYDGIVELLENLKNMGIKTAILSNKPDVTAKKVADKLFGSELIDLCFGARDGKPLKPNPEAVYEIMDIFDADRSECLYIGDTATDIQTARNAGLFSVGVLWGFRSETELREAGADVIISKPAEIARLAEI